MIYEAKCVYDGKAAHGESSWWDDKRQAVLYMDCAGARILSYDPLTEEKREYPLPFNPMAVIGCEDGGYVAASEDTVYMLDDDFTVKKEIVKVTHGKPTDRFNDCKCGPDGAFYLGAMGTLGEPDEGRLYRLTPDGELSAVIDGVGISNGFAWSKDTRTLYYTDTIHHEIYAYDFYDGRVSNRRVIFRDAGVLPDGMCIDADDNLWVALWEAGRVICVDTVSGAVLHEVRVNAPLTSSAVFGGRELDTLYITTSRLGLNKEQTDKYPLSGGLFAVKVKARGAELYRGRFT